MDDYPIKPQISIDIKEKKVVTGDKSLVVTPGQRQPFNSYSTGDSCNQS